MSDTMNEVQDILRRNHGSALEGINIALQELQDAAHDATAEERDKIALIHETLASAAKAMEDGPSASEFLTEPAKAQVRMAWYKRLYHGIAGLLRKGWELAKAGMRKFVHYLGVAARGIWAGIKRVVGFAVGLVTRAYNFVARVVAAVIGGVLDLGTGVVEEAGEAISPTTEAAEFEEEDIRGIPVATSAAA